MQPTVQTNSLRAWFLAARPKTLSGALVPVVMATALAIADGAARLWSAVLCALFAIVMQIVANLINDYYDYRRGTDGDDRLGPERAMAQGWITPSAMRWGIALHLVVAGAIGCALVWNVAQSEAAVLWPLWAIGGACVVGVFLYTLLMSYIGLGDILVYLFFGFVPVCGTYYVQALTLSTASWIVAVGCGLVVDTLLVLNNYRDRDTDRAAHKYTLVSIFGEAFGRYFYFIQGFLGCGCVYALAYMGYAEVRIVAIYMYFHLTTWLLMSRIRQGRALNQILGLTARNILIFGVLTALGLVASGYHW